MIIVGDDGMNVVEFGAGGRVILRGGGFDPSAEVAKDGIRLAKKVVDGICDEVDLHLDFMRRIADVDPGSLRLLRGCAQRLADELVTHSVKQDKNVWRYNGQRGRTILKGIFGHELWKRCYNSVLTPQQRSLFEKAQEERKKSGSKVKLGILYSALDARLCFTPEQKEKIMPLLERAMEKRSLNNHNGMDMLFSNPFYILGSSNATALKDVLDEEQTKEIDQNTNRWVQGVSENLIEAFGETSSGKSSRG